MDDVVLFLIDDGMFLQKNRFAIISHVSHKTHVSHISHKQELSCELNSEVILARILSFHFFAKTCHICMRVSCELNEYGMFLQKSNFPRDFLSLLQDSSSIALFQTNDFGASRSVSLLIRAPNSFFASRCHIEVSFDGSAFIHGMYLQKIILSLPKSPSPSFFPTFTKHKNKKWGNITIMMFPH